MSKVKALSIYPLKSAAGIDLSKTWVDHLGLSFDRRFVLSDPQGQFITARTEESLCLIQVHLTLDGLMLNAPNMPSLRIYYQHFENNYQNVTVWENEINAQHCHAQYDMWFSQYLNRPCQLLFFGEQSTRQVKNATNEVAFADGYPLLLISQASLENINMKSGVDFTMANFRPNIVVEGCTAFDEDTWKHIRIGEVEFDVVKPCSRCIFTTIDPVTGQKSMTQEPLTTLSTYRQVASGDIMFGQNLLPLNQGSIKQSDKVEVLAYQAPPIFVPASRRKLPSQSVEKRVTPKVKLEKAVQDSVASTSKKPLSILFDSWDKHVEGNNQTSILEQGEAAGLILPYSCRAGMCGRCKVKLESGEVKELANDGLSDDEKA